jgi:hypothetical protein
MNAPLSNLAGVDLVEVFTLRAEALARLYADSEIDLRTAVDELQQSLEVNGLIAAIGQDAVQAIMSEAFAAARDDLPDAEVQEEFAEADTFAQMCRKADEKQRRKGDTGLPPKAHLREPGQRVSAVNGIEHTAPDDGLTLPLDLDRTKGNGPHAWRAVRRCDHCGQPATPANALKPYDWPGRPDGIRLHRRCEEPWRSALAAMTDNQTS